MPHPFTMSPPAWRYGIAAAASVAALWLTGCASGGDAAAPAPDYGPLQVHEDKATGTKTLTLPMLAVDCGRKADCPTLGARWSSATPNRAVLWVGFVGQGQPAVEAVEFAVRGQLPLRVRSQAPASYAMAGATAFQVPMSTIERIALGKSTTVQVHAGGRVVEEELVTTTSGSAAEVGLKRLLVEAYKGTEKEEQLGLKSLFGTPYQR